MRKSLLLLLCCTHLFFVHAQKITPQVPRLKVFIDCSDTWCDMTFIRTEINIVDFLLDRVAADVHVLVTEQGTGSGGSNYQLIFFGQNRFKNQPDTLRFDTDPNATDFEERDMLIQYIKLGLAPYVAKTDAAKDVVINFKKVGDDNDTRDSLSKPFKDPWNYWVFRVGVDGNFSADEVYKSSRLSGNFSANRVTEEIKTGLEIYGGKNQTIFKIDDGNGGEEKVTTRNNDYSIQQFLVKSINPHWSYGYEANLSRSTFSNNKSRLSLESGIEYDIFPYKQVNTRFFTISYVLDARRNNYFDTTLYEKTKETLYGHSLKARLSFNQKWGTVSFGASYHNYFHNWSFLNLGANTELNIRITGGLSFYVYTYAELTRDQLFLPKEGATSQEVLTRRRQLASGYNFYTYFGINYRFGSKLNNFVNPRFN